MQMEETEKAVRAFGFELELIKINIENCASKENLQEIERRLVDFAPRNVITDMREDLDAKVSKEDFNMIVGQ